MSLLDQLHNFIKGILTRTKIAINIAHNIKQVGNCYLLSKGPILSQYFIKIGRLYRYICRGGSRNSLKGGGQNSSKGGV